MRRSQSSEGRLDVDVYAQSQSGLRELKSRLPEDSVESLAREVIRRMAEHGAGPSIETPSLDQIEGLCRLLLSEDDTAAVQGWIERGAVRKPDATELTAWNAEPNLRFNALIVQPYVLIQELPLAE